MLKATIAKWVAACESYKNGDYNAAITSFKALDPNSKILFNIGLSYARMNQHSEAVRTYSQAIQADPWLAIAYFARGCSFHQMGDSRSAAADMDDAIDRLRGHENIDYKQLGLDFQLLLCEISVNKYIAGQQNDSLLRDARSCKLFRGGDRNLLDDKCDTLLKGSRNVTMFTVEQLFSPPTIGKGGGSKGGDAKPADAKPADSGRSGGSGTRTEEKKDSSTAKPSDANKAPSSEERPKEATIKRGEDDRTRSILAANTTTTNNNNNDNDNNNSRRGAPSSLPARETPSLQSRTPSSLPRETPSLPSRDSRAAPAVPSREARESKALPAVPGKTSAASGARPLTIGDGSPDMMTLRCFYQDRRLVQIPRQGPTLELLRDRISQKFGKSGLNIRYKTSSGSSSPLYTQRDLMSAIEDGMQELYLGYDGEINEFESKAQNPSRSNTKDDSASRTTTSSSASSTPKYGSGSSSSSSAPNPFLKPSTTATASTTTTTTSSSSSTATTTATAKPSTYGSKVNSDSNQSSAARAGGTSYSNTNNDSRGYNSSASSVSARKDSSNGRSDSRSNNSNSNSNSSSSSGRNGSDSNGSGSDDGVKMIGDWQVCYTDSGETYYYNPQTNESSWEPPSSQPSPPWMVCYTDQNEKYYYNPDTDLSVWDFPG